MRDPKPIEVLDIAIWRGLMNNIRPPGTPGEIINKLRPEDRKILEQLKSDDVANVRHYI